jgi:hypothetical protein
MTVMSNDFSTALFPAASPASQVIVVTPMGNISPEARPAVGDEVHRGEMLVVTASETDTMKVTTAPSLLVPSKLKDAGTVITGEVVSSTVMTKDVSAEFPASSVALQVTVEVPRGKTLPDDNDPDIQSGTTPEVTASEAVAVKVATAPAGLVASNVVAPGVVITGLVVSCTTTEKVFVTAEF